MTKPTQKKSDALKQALEQEYGKSRGAMVVTLRLPPKMRHELNELVSERRTSLETLCGELLFNELKKRT